MSNFHLTEIALELLGNKIFDINGEPHKDLVDIFASCPKVPVPLLTNVGTGTVGPSNNLMSQLGMGEIALLSKPDSECIDFFSSEFVQILKNSAADVIGK